MPVHVSSRCGHAHRVPAACGRAERWGRRLCGPQSNKGISPGCSQRRVVSAMLGGRELSARRVEPSSAHSPDTKPLPGLGTAHHPPPKAPAPSNALASFLFLHHAGRPRLAIGWHRSGTKAKAQPEPLDSSRTHRPGAPPALQGRDRTNGLRDQNPPQVQFNAGWQTEARPCAPRGSAPRGPESPASNTQFRPCLLYTSDAADETSTV